jgi:hypothetical protein
VRVLRRCAPARPVRAYGDTAVVTARGMSGGRYQDQRFHLVERVSCVFVRQLVFGYRFGLLTRVRSEGAACVARRSSLTIRRKRRRVSAAAAQRARIKCANVCSSP